MKIVIIGNGISGITCARHLRKRSQYPITVISEESDHFYSRTALMYIYMGHMKYENTKPYEDHFWKKNAIDLVRKTVVNINTKAKSINFTDSGAMPYDILILATGSKSNTSGWPGQTLKGVQTLYSLQDLYSLEENSKGVSKAVIVGGGLIGIEMAEMLRSRNIHVTFLVREKSFWNTILPPEESALINRHILEHHVDLRLGSALKEIIDNGNGGIKAVLTEEGEEIPCTLVALAVGVSPNIAFLKNTEIKTDKGILVNAFFETSIPDIYAIGDCAQFLEPLPGRRPVEQVWYTGRMHGETLAHTLTGKKTAYRPGHWFNSAKFLDIEYQTYGVIAAKPIANTSSFYWEASDGKICFRLVYESQTEILLGINVLGIRMRHLVIDRWLSEKRNADYVIEHLSDALFDPELFKHYEKYLVEKYNRDHNKSITIAKKSWKRILNLQK
jgi:NAD(P)H-nitrite reductase large subunit